MDHDQFGSDRLVVEELAESVDAAWVRATFKTRYGRGWQKKLSNALAIGESTLSGWLSRDTVPTWAKLALRALTLRDQDSEVMRICRTERGYALYSYENRIGRFKAGLIPTEEDAFLFAAAPALKSACAEAWVVLDDAGFEVWGDIVRRLKDALDAAEPEIPEAVAPQEEERQ